MIPTHRRPSAGRFAAGLAALALVATVLTGCLSAPGDTSQIQLVGTSSASGFTIEHYRNLAYPCSVDGYQSFAVLTRTGSDPDADAPLWVKMHGGGVGYFDTSGTPVPNDRLMTEELLPELLNSVDAGLMTTALGAPEGFRGLVVSMCSHDLYAGANTSDPNNPNTTPDGAPRTTNGLLATKAAIQFTTGRYPSDDVVLHGGSAGSAGALHVAWSLQQQGIPPTAIVADAGVLNQRYEQAQIDQGLPCARTGDAAEFVLGRMHPDVANPANQPDLLVSSGRLTVPVLHVWSEQDWNVCGAVLMDCPLPDGSTATMMSAACAHEPLRLAIEAQGPASRSENFIVCADDTTRPGPCDRHVVLNGSGVVNTAPGGPANPRTYAMDWVRQRLADD